MAQTKDIVWLEKRIAQEEARLAALAAKLNDPNQQTEYQAQGEVVQMLVPSFHNPEELYYIVRDTKASIELVCGTSDAAGLAKIGCKPLAADIGTAAKVNNKYNTTKYPRVLIVTGKATPTRETTAWQTKWIKNYAEDSDKQSHRLIPFGFDISITTNPSFEDVYEWFVIQFEPTSNTSLIKDMPINTTASLILGKNSVVGSFKKG